MSVRSASLCEQALTRAAPSRVLRLNAIALTTMIVAVWAPGGSGQEASRLQTYVSGRTIQPGEIVRLDVTCDCEAMGATATAFGRAVPLFRTGEAGRWRGLIGIDLDVSPGTYPMTVAVDPVEPASIAVTRELAVIGKRFPIRRLRVPARFVSPPESAIERIEDESHRLETLFQTVTRPRQWHRPFEAPARAPTSGRFGMRSVFNGQPRSPHSGVDFRSKEGTPVTAPATGVVTISEPLFFTGNTVVIDHGLGLYSLLAHLSKIGVRRGERVLRGHVVGFVGSTGRVTAPHLHWSVRLNGARVDPLSLIAITNDWRDGLE